MVQLLTPVACFLACFSSQVEINMLHLDPCQHTIVMGFYNHNEHFHVTFHHNQKEASLYEVGDKVWLNRQNITMTHLMKKLDHKWLGPYVVDKVISQNAYRLKLPPSFSQTHPVFSVTLLQPYNTYVITE